VYSGNDSTTDFALAHKVYDQSDVVVLLTVDATSVTTTQTITTHYTVAGVAADAHAATTPTITMLTAPATGETLTIYRLGDLIQSTTFATTTFWRSLSAEKQIDLIVMDLQYLKLLLDRCAIGSLASAAVTTTLEELLVASGLIPISGLTGKPTLVAADLIIAGDSADSFVAKKATLTNLITFILTQFINTSAGAGDAGKGIKLDAAGQVALNMLKKVVRGGPVQILGLTTDVTVADGLGYFTIPSFMDGMNLTRAQAFVGTAGTTNATTFQLYNVTKAQDMLSVNISIASAANVGTPGTIDTGADNVSTDDIIRVDCDAVSTTAPKGLWIQPEFTTP
jgi:hypothetical protein